MAEVAANYKTNNDAVKSENGPTPFPNHSLIFGSPSSQFIGLWPTHWFPRGLSGGF
jgi:hypothetical protein